MNTVLPVSTVATTPALVHLLELRRAVDGTRLPGEMPYLLTPIDRNLTTPAIKRIAALGSMVDRYL